jgi:hypothetical protein
VGANDGGGMGWEFSVFGFQFSVAEGEEVYREGAKSAKGKVRERKADVDRNVSEALRPQDSCLTPQPSEVYREGAKSAKGGVWCQVAGSDFRLLPVPALDSGLWTLDFAPRRRRWLRAKR